MDAFRNSRTETGVPQGSAHGVQLRSTWLIWRTILWREWHVNRHLILNLFGLWLVVTLVLPVFVRTTPVVLTSVMLGQLLAVRLAGGDAGWGSEAISLSLPPSRGAYFWIRFLFGVVVTGVFLLVGHFSVLSQLGAQLWGLVVESGMTDGAYSLDWFDSWGRAFALVMGSYALTRTRNLKELSVVGLRVPLRSGGGRSADFDWA